MAEHPEFIRKQYEFAAHIRNPEKNPLPSDVEQRRMNVYSELFYNNVEGFMSSTFPVLRSLYDDGSWHALVRDYFENHRAHTPLFPEVPREFLKYLESEREAQDDDFPFLLELAHYEWVELALAVSDQEIQENENIPDDILACKLSLSALAWPLSYQYPVHQISPEFTPTEPGDTPTFIIAYRDSEDEVHFMEINPVTAHLVHLISENPDITARQHLEQIAEELSHLQKDAILNGGRETLNNLLDKNILLVKK
ncbi:MAG: putative DNA-binding domain-containing protein [Gammaproteobacteria bacterium]